MSLAATDETHLPAAAGAMGALAAAWRRTGRDPFGVLLPAGAALLVQATAILVWWRLPLEVGSWLAFGALLWVASGLASAPMRAAILGAGARAAGRRGVGLRRAMSLVGVVILVGALQLFALAGIAAVWSLGTALLLSYGLVSAAALLGAGALLVGVAVSFAIRVRFAYAPVQAVDGGRAAWRALARPQGVSWGQTAAAVLTADILLGCGALLVGAGALPGYALHDLAVQRLWEDLA